MKKFIFGLLKFINTLFICISANCTVLIIKKDAWGTIPFLALIFIFANIMPLIYSWENSSARIAVCRHGTECLKMFLVSAVISAAYHITAAFFLFPSEWKLWLISAVICIAALSILFWNGMICVYCTSVQLGLRLRILGAVFGMIPMFNIYFLIKIIKTTSSEVKFESQKIHINKLRKNLAICATKYPLLLVHGVFFRDSRYLNYWGRIPSELKSNGAKIYYGNQQSAASAEEGGRELASRIHQIINETGCKKVNVIAHSKGGIDIRCAMNTGDTANYIASVTTINTPHRGCEFADYLLEKLPKKMQDNVSQAYNTTLKKLGDSNPDFMSAVKDLTAEICISRDKSLKYPDNVYCQSIGSKLEHASGGKFPLNFTYHLVKYFDGANDGLVSEKSFKWGEKYTLLKPAGKRGISHGDIIDLNRENIPGFDVREFYVELVADLKRRGY